MKNAIRSTIGEKRHLDLRWSVVKRTARRKDVGRSIEENQIRIERRKAPMTDEESLTSSRSFVSDDDDASHRTSSSLNNYSILPPIRSATTDEDKQPNEFLKHLQEKYQSNDRTGSSAILFASSFRFVQVQRS